MSSSSIFLFCVSIYLLNVVQNKIVMVTMVFTSTICYTMVPPLLALHLITSPFVRRVRRSLERLQSNLSALDWKFGVWDLELLLFLNKEKKKLIPVIRTWSLMFLSDIAE